MSTHSTPRAAVSVSDLQSDIESALAHIRELDEQGALPHGLRPLLLLSPVEGSSVHVSLRHRDHARQIRRTFGAEAFTQGNCAAWIVFETPPLEAERDSPAAEQREKPRAERSFARRDDFEDELPHPRERSFQRQGHGGDPLADFVFALHEAESQPQLKFVSLKWFRDTYLPRAGYPWAQDLETPRRVLEDATARDMVLTSKVPNPKQPTFPVTAIHLNRDHPDVRRILGG